MRQLNIDDAFRIARTLATITTLKGQEAAPMHDSTLLADITKGVVLMLTSLIASQ